MKTKALVQEGHRIGELALINYRDWFVFDNDTDREIVNTIKRDLDNHNILECFYIREALADYKTNLEGQLANDPTNTAYQDDIDLIDELFKQNIV